MSRAERLAELYRRIPRVECRGLCAPTCSALVPCALIEAQACEAAAQARPKGPPRPDGPNACRYLEAGRCAVYEARPTVCRLLGAVDHAMLDCGHGCAAEGRLSRESARAILAEVESIGGGTVILSDAETWGRR